MVLNTNIGPERVQVFPQAIGTTQVPGASLSDAFILLSTSQVGAPVNAPTRFTDLQSVVDTFGGPDEMGNLAYYAVKGFFDNAGTGSAGAVIINVGASATASDFIGTAAASSGIRALDGFDEVGLIMAPGLALSDAYLVQPALIDYAETVRAEFGATLSTTFSLATMPKEITTSSTDQTQTTAQLTSITGSGPWVMDIQILGSASAATGIYTVIDYTALSGATVTVDGVVYTEGVEWTAATDNDTTATSLASAIDGGANVGAAAVGAVITVTASTPGLAGNSITTVTSDAVNLTVSGATLSGGLDGDADLSEITAGMIATDTAGTSKFVISAVDDSADTITVITDPSSAFTPGDDVLIKIPSAVTYKETVINNPSKTHAWYFNHVSVLAEEAAASAGDIQIVDPVGHVAGIISRIDANSSIGGPSHAPAGIRFAGISGILGLQLQLSERVDGEALRLSFINRITSFPGSGNIVFGGYTADSGTSPAFTADEQLVQVIRSIQFIKASLEPGLRSFIWENFSPSTQSQISGSILSFLRNNSYLFPAGLPESQQFQVIPVEATQDELDKGLLRVRVQVRPNKAVRFIEVALEFPLPTA